ncbi:MAG TPA: hypothetical protein VFA43_00055 [Gemmatimonadaceae bacterium]|nr:hypothetical protein [Gemmatimonadaceae bacterium]
MTSPSIPRIPNVDVNRKPILLPSEKDIIAPSTFDDFCTVLELIAGILHLSAGGTNESTTTVGLITEISTLFLTSQKITKFEATKAQIHAMIDDLASTTYMGLLKTMDLGALSKLDEDAIVALRQKAGKKDKDAKAMVTNLSYLYFTVYPNMLRLQDIQKRAPMVFTKLKEWIVNIEVITTQDLFCTRAPTTTGLHGEGRFVRYCYIRYIKGLREIELELDQPSSKFVMPSPEQTFKSRLQDAADYVGTLLAKEIRQMRILCASSQGTCNDCQKLLGKLMIAHNTQRYSHESDSPNWVDPFTMADKNSSYKPRAILAAAEVGKVLAQWAHEERQEVATSSSMTD